MQLEFEVHLRERKANYLRATVVLKRNVAATARYLRLYGNCVSQKRVTEIKAHLRDLVIAIAQRESEQHNLMLTRSTKHKTVSLHGSYKTQEVA